MNDLATKLIAICVLTVILIVAWQYFKDTPIGKVATTVGKVLWGVMKFLWGLLKPIGKMFLRE